MTTQMRDIQVTLCDGVQNMDDYIDRCGMNCLAGTHDFQWSKMGKYFIAPKEVIIVPRFKGFIWISFDYVRVYDCEVVLISEKIITSHFKEMFSLN